MWGVCLDQSPHPGSRRTRRVRFECHMGSAIPTRTICRYIGVRYFRLARAVPVFTPEWVWAGSPASGSPCPTSGSPSLTGVEATPSTHKPSSGTPSPDMRITHHGGSGCRPRPQNASNGSTSPDMRITLHDGSGGTRQARTRNRGGHTAPTCGSPCMTGVDAAAHTRTMYPPVSNTCHLTAADRLKVSRLVDPQFRYLPSCSTRSLAG